MKGYEEQIRNAKGQRRDEIRKRRNEMRWAN
jgi:hypothetical protein